MNLYGWPKSLFNSLQVGILIIDAKTKTIVDVNPAAALMVGLNRDDIVGSSCSLFGCSASSKCPVIDLGLDVENEVRTLVRGDGTELYVSTTITSALWNNKKYLIESFINVAGFMEKYEKDWQEVEKLLSANITEMKKTIHRNPASDTAKVKQDLHSALNMMMGE